MEAERRRLNEERQRLEEERRKKEEEERLKREEGERLRKEAEQKRRIQEQKRKREEEERKRKLEEEQRLRLEEERRLLEEERRKLEEEKLKREKEIDNGNSTLIIDFYKLYYHLFESNRLDNSKPYKFVDYLITGDNLLFNLKKDKNRFEEIKKGITLKQKNNSLINEQLLNKSIYEYLRCDFSNCFMKKLSI